MLRHSRVQASCWSWVWSWADGCIQLSYCSSKAHKGRKWNHFCRTFPWRSSTWQCHSGSVSWQCSAQCNPVNAAYGLYMLEVYKIMSGANKAKWPQSFAVPQNWPKEGKRFALKKKKNNTNPKEPPTHTACQPKVHYKIYKILQQLLYTNVLQIPWHFEVRLQHHSDHTIYLTKSQLHWKLVVSVTLSWCIFSSICSIWCNCQNQTRLLWSNWFSNLQLGRRKEWE